MNPRRWERVENIYFKALPLSPPARDAVIIAECAEDPALQREVRTLLAYCDKVGNFLEQSAVDVVLHTFGVDASQLPREYSNDLVGRVIGDRYTVEALVGAGGNAEVYRAQHRLLGSTVAVKRLLGGLRDHKEYRLRFIEEARRAASLEHENIARVIDVVEQPDEVFVIMEYIDGETLRARLRGPIELDGFLPIAIECASALAAAHEQRIVHLDIKPENIMLTAAGTVKICDFGMSHRLAAPDLSPALAEPWKFGGTPAYMAAEVQESNLFDERADIFSLGVVFYEMLSGKNPFMTDDIKTTMHRVATEEVPPLPSGPGKLPRRLVQLISRMLQKDPTKRIASATEVLRELETVQRNQTIVGAVAGVVSDMVRWARSSPRAAASTALVLALLVAGIMYFRASQLPHEKALVVLPFEFIGDSADTRLYSLGLNDLLTANLTKLTRNPDLQIIPSSEVRSHGVDTADQARREFAANLVLAGTFQDLGSDIRIVYSLIDTKNVRQLRGNTLTVAKGDPFSVQNALVDSILSMLELELSSTEREALTQFGTMNPQAYVLYNQAQGSLHEFQKPENIDRAIEVFNQALNLDSQYAAAYAGLGLGYWLKYQQTSDNSLVEPARRACLQGALLDSRLAVAHLCLGTVDHGIGEYERAALEFSEAINYEPTLDDAHRGLALALQSQGKFDGAEKAYRQAIQTRKHYWASYLWLGGFYERQGRFPEAIEEYKMALAYSPGNGQVLKSLGVPYVRLGQYDKAIDIFEQAVKVQPSGESYNNLGLAYLLARRYNNAIPMLEQAATLTQHYRRTGNLARAYQLAGQHQKAGELYERAIREGEQRLVVNPRDSDAHLLIGRYHAAVGHKEPAVTHLGIALAARPDDAHYLTLGAVAYTQLQDFDTALTMLEKARALGLTRVQIEAEPELDALRVTGRFKTILGGN